MRQAINENRTVQLVLLGAMVLLGGILLLQSGGSGSKSSAATTGASGSSGGVSSTAAPVAPSGTTAAATPAAAAPAGAAPTSSTSSAPAPKVPPSLVPGPGLPQSLLRAYKKGDAVALLVIRAGGTDDGLLRGYVRALNGIQGVAVFSTKAEHIARFSWLTQGVDLSDLPALVMLRPRRLSNGVPTASVSYGFRDPASVVQAARDGLYRGPSNLPYHP